MNQKWIDIWNNRPQKHVANKQTPEDILTYLINLDGFDDGAGKITAEDWLEYIKIISKKMAIAPHHSVFEVGCGAGAFLFALKNFMGIYKVSGLDYAKNLVQIASDVLNSKDIQCAEAKDLCTENAFDFVIANSVFHYFNLNYANIVLEKMVQKSTIATVILEVPSEEKKNQSEHMRQGHLSHDEYSKRYKGLEHTYYSQLWFEDFAKKNSLKLEFFNQCVPNYKQNLFRKNYILWKI